MNATIVYLLTAFAGAGLYCLMPRSVPFGARMRWSGGILGGAALAGLLVFLAGRFGPSESVNGYFYLFAGLAIVSASRVITHPRPVYCVLYFILVVLSVTGLMLLLSAEFLAVALVIIYAGAILVTYAFVIMLAQQSGTTVYDRVAREPFAAVLAGFMLTGTVAAQLADAELANPAPSAAGAQAATSNTLEVGTLLLTRYVVTLEVAGVLLLVAMVGGILLARKPLPDDVTQRQASESVPGQAGREVKPF